MKKRILSAIVSSVLYFALFFTGCSARHFTYAPGSLCIDMNPPSQIPLSQPPSPLPVPLTPSIAPPMPTHLVELPSFVVPVIALNAKGEDAAYANAILLDKSRGLFLINAHFYADAPGLQFLVRINDTWYPAFSNSKRSRIYWQKDLAAVMLKPPFPNLDFMELPTFAILPAKNSPVTIKGFFPRRDDDNKDSRARSSFIPYEVPGIVARQKSSWAINCCSEVDVLKAQLNLALGKPVPPVQLKLLYKDYILIFKEPGINYFEHGLSGAPALNNKEEIVGINVGGMGMSTLLMPADEIVRFFSNLVANTK